MSTPSDRAVRDVTALFNALDGKLAQDDLDALTLVFESISEQATSMDDEMNRLKAKNRQLRALLSESRRVLRADHEDYVSRSFLGRLFGV